MADDELAAMLDELDDSTEPKLSIVPARNEPVQPGLELEVLVPELVKRFVDKFDVMSGRESEDRTKLRDVINYIEGIVFNTRDPKRAHLEQLVSAYRVLMDSNANQTRALDALSKLLVAGKGTQVMINNNNNIEATPQDELVALLEEDDRSRSQ